MAGNIFGKLFRVLTFGESHGKALGCVIDGCPSQIPLSEKDIQQELDKRAPGQSLVTTSRKEPDKVKILSGVFEGKTLGTPIMMIVENKDMRSQDYEKLKNIYRPGHADYAWELKFGFRDFRGGGRASGRETIGRVMAGAVAKKLLKTWAVEIYAYSHQIGNITGEKVNLNFIEKNPVRSADPKKAKEMENYILKMKHEGDSIGGIVHIIVKNMPKGLGEPVFDKLNADLAKALFSIPGVKAVEFDIGRKAALLKGSEYNKLRCGISGGISIGKDLLIQVAIKPASSISKPQEAFGKHGRKRKIQVKGRHDPCITPRLIPVAESMAAITLIDHVLRYRAIKF